MSSKRSYLDSLNAGRSRKAHASLEELNRSLESLGQKLERSRDMPAMRDERAPRRSQWAETDMNFRERPSEDWRSRAAAPSARVNEQPYAPRREDDGSMGRIASELKGLREELRQQMTAGIRREFDVLRSEVERASASQASVRADAELGVEFERLSDAIHALSERGDDKSINMLRLELEQVKGVLDSLAREETVLSVDRRWDDFNTRWSTLENKLSGSLTRNGDPALGALSARLEQISDAVNGLPESLSLRSLEDKVRTLAGAVDQFTSQQDRRGSDFNALIEERLDEISRAIVATTSTLQAPHVDPEPFERIEARITSLAHQLEELAEDRPSSEVIDRLSFLSQRVDEIAERASVPEKSVERLGRQIAAIADRIENAPPAMQAEHILQGMEQRFEMLSQMIDRRQDDALEHGQALFRDLERRLEGVAERLDERNAPSLDNAGIMSAIDQRFSDLAQKLEGRAADPVGGVLMRELESRLENISTRLETSTAHVAAINPDLIRSLESQVNNLSRHLSEPGARGDLGDIGPRLDHIEKSIAGNRDSVLEVAREAAENAVRSFSGSPTEAAAVAGLADDLKSLEALNRRSDERNTKTFEAIHDTLLKIVERLGSLENTPRESRQAGVKLSVDDAPSLAPVEAMSLDMRGEKRSDAKRTPAEAAVAAAVAALDSDNGETVEGGGRMRSMLGGLSRALGSKKERAEPQLAGADLPEPQAEAPTLDLDEPLDPKNANQPLEPGSGAPDLQAIMRRVRDERGQPVRHNETDAAKSDFIAAARRAAQAAAADAGMVRKSPDSSGKGGRSSIGDFLKNRRKPILMAAVAVMLALAGLQLGKAFMADGSETASKAEPAIEQTAEIAPAPAEPIASATSEDPGQVRMVDMPPETGEPDLAGQQVPPEELVEEASPAPSPMAPDAATETAALPEQQSAAASPEPNPGAGSPAAESSAPATQTAIAGIPVEAGPVALREAAEAGDAKALFEIGSRYAEGRGVKTDLPAAAKWYEKSAEMGFAPAQYRIGNFFEKGTGVERDIPKAKTWYQMAAEQGNASAMHNLAVLYAMGADGTADNESAARWFLQAAELGVKDSQFNLGILAAKGVGMPQDLEESYKWFALVAKAGDRDAAAKRDEIANALRPEQLERARATTELWKPKPVKAEANSFEVPEGWTESQAKTASVDMKKAVRNIQVILNKNGYDAGGADGVMGGKTKTAIAAFQKDNGMEPTGEIDEKLVRVLLEKK